MVKYIEYINSKEWKETRKRFLEILGKKCSGCKREKSVQLHHLTYVRLGRELLEDVLPLCVRCHKKVHRLRKREGLSIKSSTAIVMTQMALKSSNLDEK